MPRIIESKDKNASKTVGNLGVLVVSIVFWSIVFVSTCIKLSIDDFFNNLEHLANCPSVRLIFELPVRNRLGETLEILATNKKTARHSLGAEKERHQDDRIRVAKYMPNNLLLLC